MRHSWGAKLRFLGCIFIFLGGAGCLRVIEPIIPQLELCAKGRKLSAMKSGVSSIGGVMQSPVSNTRPGAPSCPVEKERAPRKLDFHSFRVRMRPMPDGNDRRSKTAPGKEARMSSNKDLREIQASASRRSLAELISCGTSIAQPRSGFPPMLNPLIQRWKNQQRQQSGCDYGNS